MWARMDIMQFLLLPSISKVNVGSYDGLGRLPSSTHGSLICFQSFAVSSLEKWNALVLNFTGLCSTCQLNLERCKGAKL